MAMMGAVAKETPNETNGPGGGRKGVGQRFPDSSLLFDYYGALLGERQREVYALYHEDNLSLTEIAEDLAVTKQAVHTALKKAERALAGYEESLGLVAKHEAYEGVLRDAQARVDGILAAYGSQLETADVKGLMRLKRQIAALDV